MEHAKDGFAPADLEKIKECGEIIKRGGLVAFPTETVYGLGGDALNGSSSGKIYAAKGRPSDNPLIVHICDIASLEKITEDIPEYAYVLAEKFWPGPLTMILKASDAVPRKTTGGLDTVAVRMPDDDIALAFIKASGGYIAAPSANLSGKPSPTSAGYVLEDMDGRIDAVIDGGENVIGLESTIIDLAGDKIQVLRPGFITNEMLSDALGISVETDPALLDPSCSERPKAPGMRYRHYAPKGDVIPVKGDPDKVFGHISEGLAEAGRKGLKTGVICCAENAAKYDADVVRHAGSLDDAEAAAHIFYTALRDMDDEEVNVIFVENFTEEGFGEALWNRLLKSAGSKWEEA
ncbi:MAG: threonylcarbamoyl-AMP synthase [Lachnospiraceae bacterium]|nr:threonylcarbamoyl-AMP synthase [Lachnospiraceae bacterium]